MAEDAEAKRRRAALEEQRRVDKQKFDQERKRIADEAREERRKIDEQRREREQRNKDE